MTTSRQGAPHKARRRQFPSPLRPPTRPLALLLFLLASIFALASAAPSQHDGNQGDPGFRRPPLVVHGALGAAGILASPYSRGRAGVGGHGSASASSSSSSLDGSASSAQAALQIVSPNNGDVLEHSAVDIVVHVNGFDMEGEDGSGSGSGNGIRDPERGERKLCVLLSALSVGEVRSAERCFPSAVNINAAGLKLGETYSLRVMLFEDVRVVAMSVRKFRVASVGGYVAELWQSCGRAVAELCACMRVSVC